MVEECDARLDPQQVEDLVATLATLRHILPAPPPAPAARTRP